MRCSSSRSFWTGPSGTSARPCSTRASHAFNFARDPSRPDCSQSQYDNGRFRAAAEELGLVVARVPHYGCAYTTLPEPTADSYRQEMATLEAVQVHRIGQKAGRTDHDAPHRRRNERDDANAHAIVEEHQGHLRVRVHHQDEQENACEHDHPVRKVLI